MIGTNSYVKCHKLYLILLVLCYFLPNFHFSITRRLFFGLALLMLFQSSIDSYPDLGKSVSSFFFLSLFFAFNKLFPAKVKADSSYCTFRIFFFTKLVCTGQKAVRNHLGAVGYSMLISIMLGDYCY